LLFLPEKVKRIQKPSCKVCWRTSSG